MKIENNKTFSTDNIIINFFISYSHYNTSKQFDESVFISSNKEETTTWDNIGGSLEYEEAAPNYSGDMAKWANGIDSDTKLPKLPDLQLEDIYSESEIDRIAIEKGMEEAKNVARESDEAMLRNNEKIEQMDNHIIEISELSEEDLEALYHDEDTSESDKSIIACIGIIRAAYGNDPLTKDNVELFQNVSEVTQNYYGFNIVEAQEILKSHDSHFRILTKKEREAVAGSIEDMASAALESFVKNPDYHNSRILDYDDYLHGIMLDCTKKTVRQENGVSVIDEKVDTEEFQERIVESMSWVLWDREYRERVYSKEEFEKLQEQSADLYADFQTGHYFRNDFEEYDGQVMVAGQENLRSMYGFNDPKRERSFWKRFARRVRRNNAEVFKYNGEIASLEMKPWADTINLDKVEEINDNMELSAERKLVTMTEYIQEALGVLNLDEDGQSRPIEVKWFQPEEPKVKKALQKLINNRMEKEELPEMYAGAFYRHSERSIYYMKPSESEQKLPNYAIAAIAHEMWHAKQFEMRDEVVKRDAFANNSAKERMYRKNDMSYQGLGRTARINGNRDYYWQILEQEAYAIEYHIWEKLERRSYKERGKKSLGIFFGR